MCNPNSTVKITLKCMHSFAGRIFADGESWRTLQHRKTANGVDR